MPKEFFRKKVIENRRSKSNFGETILPNLITLKLVIIFSIFIFTLFIFLFVFGSYTERRTVSGYLTPVQGLVKIVSLNPGVIENIKIKDGEKVNKNDELLIIKNEQYGDQGTYNDRIRLNLVERLKNLENQKPLVKQSYQENIKSLDIEIEKTVDQIDLNKEKEKNLLEKFKLLNQQYKRYLDGSRDGAISKIEAQNVYEKIIELKISINSLLETGRVLKGNIQNMSVQREQIKIQEQKDINEITIQESSIKQNLIEIERQTKSVIISPVSGKITAINTNINQYVISNKPLLSIIPDNSKLKATLLLSPRDIGFIKIGDPVSIRYNAFPYEKYGQAKGRIESISKTTVLKTDLVDISGISLNINTDDSVYLVDINLEKQSIMIDGNSRLLETGMTLNADIKLENRKLYQWIFEPLISLNERNK